MKKSWTDDQPMVLKVSQRNDTPVKNKFLIDDQKPPKKIRSFWFRHLMEFFKTTNLHGYKYLAMDSVNSWEKFCWTIAVIVCLISAISLVLIAWQWNSINATITVIETTHHPIWRMPFPAVTICSLNKVSKKKAWAFAKNVTIPIDLNLTAEALYSSMTLTAAILGNVLLEPVQLKQMFALQKVLDHNNLTVIQFIQRVSPTCEELLERCSWKSTTIRCANLFHKTFSVEGYCCSFNYYARNITGENRVAKTRPKNPRRIAACGFQTALSVLFRTVPQDYYSSTFGTYGIRVYVHYSYEYPDENSSAKLVGPGTETFFEISPENTYTTSAINGLNIKKRNCVFPNELPSQIFVRYSYSNCLSELRSDIIFEMCRCVPYFLPSNFTDRLCNFNDIDCVYKARVRYASSLPKINNSRVCMPDCEHNTYPMEMASGKLTPVKAHNSLNFFKNVRITNQSLLHIYFSDLVGIRFRKDVFLNWHNLLASFGGLLGLFIGFSLVSGFEMIYFFTVRFFFDMAQRKAPAADGNEGTKARGGVIEKGLSDDHLMSKWVKKYNRVQVVTPEKPEKSKGRF